MTANRTPVINIGLVGAGDLCVDLLQKTTFDYSKGEVNAQIVAVADPDRRSPGMVLAKELGLIAVSDYKELYAPGFGIGLLFILTPGDALFKDILNTRPDNIRILSHDVFDMLWTAIIAEEQKLRERNLEVETILNGIEDFIIVISPEKDVLDVNETFLTKMGYTRDEVIGKKCYNIFQRGEAACLATGMDCPLSEVVHKRGMVQSVIRRSRHADEEKFFEVTVYPIWEKDGKISKFIEISRDITQRKREEEEITGRLEEMVKERTRQLKETHEKLLHHDKMASLGKLSASVVHEINNPIAGILNLIMLTKRIAAEDGFSKEAVSQFNHFLELMEGETRRVSRIVSNLLSFSRQTKMALTPVSLERLIEKTLILNSNLLKLNGVRVVKAFSPAVPDITGAEDQLQQVFMNLFSNSIEAMENEAEGVLEIWADHSPTRGVVTLGFKDNGVGISPKNKAKLFEPFFTTKKKSKGVGLGLSVAYGIIEDHNATIRVESELGQGAAFTIEFPVERKHGDPHG